MIRLFRWYFFIRFFNGLDPALAAEPGFHDQTPSALTVWGFRTGIHHTYCQNCSNTSRKILWGPTPAYGESVAAGSLLGFNTTPIFLLADTRDCPAPLPLHRLQRPSPTPNVSTASAGLKLKPSFAVILDVLRAGTKARPIREGSLPLVNVRFKFLGFWQRPLRLEQEEKLARGRENLTELCCQIRHEVF